MDIFSLLEVPADFSQAVLAFGYVQAFFLRFRVFGTGITGSRVFILMSFVTDVPRSENPRVSLLHR